MRHLKLSLATAVVICLIILSCCEPPSSTKGKIYSVASVTIGGAKITLSPKIPPDITQLSSFYGYFRVTLTIDAAFVISTDDPKYKCIADAVKDAASLFIFENPASLPDFFVTGLKCYNAFAASSLRNSETMINRPANSDTNLLCYFTFPSPSLASRCGSDDGCHQARFEPPTTRTPPAPKLVVRSAQCNGGCSAFASCNAGEHLVGGGFLADTLVLPVSSYPSSSTTWTASGYYDGGTSNSFTVYAVCLQSNFPVTEIIVSNTQITSSSPTTVSASCPSGTVLTGGGFTAGGYLEGSFPNGKEWSVTVRDAGVSQQVFALCAKTNLSAADQPKSSFSVSEDSPTASSIACSQGRLLTAGG